MRALRRLGPRAASARLALAAGLVTAVVLLAFSPLTGVPGPESALVLGVVLPPFVAAAAARRVLAARREGAGLSSALTASLGLALAAWALPVTLLALDGLRVRWCAPAEGLAFVALGPGLGVLLAALVGVGAATIIGGPRRATALAALAPVLSLAGTAQLFYTTPAIFGFDHFFGYFPGTLYDPDVSIEPTYLTFRALTLARIGSLASLLVGAVDPASLRTTLTQARRAPRALALGLALLGASAIGEWYATDLGHRSTAASIRERLGTTLEGRACEIVVPRELPRAQAARLLDDCELRVAQLERALGLGPGPRITAYFFRRAEEKRALMGASHTYIAKPWRREVYLQLSGWPHPVLHHELAHAVAGRIGRGPFRISGRLGGLLPSAGIVEGLAVALAWEDSDALTPHQWARAMRDLGMAPSIAETEGLGFLLQPASRAYVSTGSFVRWILDTRGPAVVRALYASGDHAAALGTSLAEAERGWNAFLDTVPLPPDAMELAAARFERPAIFAQVCPHRVAALRERYGDALAAGDAEGAVRGCAEVLEIDPGDPGARASRAIALARSGRIDEALEALDALGGPHGAGRPVVRAARQGIGDALWARGDARGAAAQYRAILEDPLRDDEARQVEVRLLALEAGAEGGDALRELLAPPPAEPHDGATAMHALARLSALRADGLGPYLEARQLAQRERYDLAAPRIAEALARGLPTPRLRREATRLDGEIATAQGERARAIARWQAIERDADSTEAAKVEARDWLARLAWHESP